MLTVGSCELVALLRSESAQSQESLPEPIMYWTKMTRRRTLPLYDAVHGTIDFNDPSLFDCHDTLQVLLGSKHLQRLHRIQQLPFGEHAYLSSTHDRFGHAVGTAHVALRILQRLRRTDF